MTTKINTVDVVDPYDFSATIERMGSLRRSANGTVMLDYFTTTPKYKIKLQWRLLTSGDRSTLMTQLTSCVTGARALLLPDGRTFTVYLDIETDITETLIRDAGGYKYNLSASFIEA
jgi:hypothetical protein